MLCLGLVPLVLGCRGQDRPHEIQASVALEAAKPAQCPLADTVGLSQLDSAAFNRMRQLAAKDEIKKTVARLAFKSIHYAISRDLDCDSGEDLVVIGLRRQRDEKILAAAMAVVFDWRSDPAPGDARAPIYDPGYLDDIPTPVLFVDLDGDGMEDVVSQYFMAAVTTYVYLLDRDTILSIRDPLLELVPLERETDHCIDMVRPRVVRREESGVPTLLAPVQKGSGRAVAGCEFEIASFRIHEEAVHWDYSQ